MTITTPQKPHKQKTTEQSDSGFTLIELMVVIVIIGLLATVVVINILPSQDRAMAEKTKADIATIEKALLLYRMHNMTYPTSAQGLEALVSAPEGLSQPQRYQPGGYIKSLPTDPWGNAYQYRYPGERGEFDIYSLGSDGRDGGEGLAADIGNWTNQ